MIAENRIHSKTHSPVVPKRTDRQAAAVHVDYLHRQIQIAGRFVQTNAQIAGAQQLRIVVRLEPGQHDLHTAPDLVFNLIRKKFLLRTSTGDYADDVRQVAALAAELLVVVERGQQNTEIFVLRPACARHYERRPARFLHHSIVDRVVVGYSGAIPILHILELFVDQLQLLQ